VPDDQRGDPAPAEQHPGIGENVTAQQADITALVLRQASGRTEPAAGPGTDIAMVS
jgi:hypothetical protein